MFSLLNAPQSLSKLNDSSTELLLLKTSIKMLDKDWL